MVEFSVESWQTLQTSLVDLVGKEPSLEGILFLIGLRELGASPHAQFSKEEKQDLLNVAICAISSKSGFYHYIGRDADNWPHWKQLNPIPKMTHSEQDIFLKTHILNYFSELFVEPTKPYRSQD